jgi:hypothetical protein
MLSLSMPSSTAYGQDIKSQTEPPAEEKIVVKSSGVTVDKDGNYVMSAEDFALMWTHIEQLEFEVEAGKKRVEELEALAKSENMRANAHWRARIVAEKKIEDRDLIIKVIVITSLVFIAGGVTIGAVAN